MLMMSCCAAMPATCTIMSLIKLKKKLLRLDLPTLPNLNLLINGFCILSKFIWKIQFGDK